LSELVAVTHGGVGAQFSHDFGTQCFDAAANARHNYHAQANDRCGQSNSVNGYSARFVVEEFVDDVLKCHGKFPFKEVLYSDFSTVWVISVEPLFRPDLHRGMPF
jgi:hypothetical protein